MKRRNRLASVVAIAAVTVGAGASAAAAYSISGGPYIGVPLNDHQFTTGGVYTYTCPASHTTFTGTATGADTTHLTPYYGGAGACNTFGFPVTVIQSGTWSLRVTAGPDAGGWYAGELQVPSGTSTAVDWPLSGCVFDVAGPQSFPDAARMRNTSSGVELTADVSGIGFAVRPSSSCPFPSSDDGVYATNGVVEIPGITIS